MSEIDRSSSGAIRKDGQEHGNHGVIMRFGSYVVWCQCGFLESGWPNMAVGKASLDNHLAKVKV